MKYSFVAAALVGAVLATPHKGHAGFHARRGEYAAQEGVCTVYTTVYATAPAPLPTIVANSTAAYPTGAPSAYTPVVLTSTPEAAESSKEAYPTAPAPASSTSCTEEKETSAYTPAPVPSEAAYPPAPQPEAPKPVSSAAAYPPAPQPEAPKPVSSAAAYPPAPQPEAPKPVSSAAAYPPAPPPEAPKPVSSAAAYPPAPKPEAPKPVSSDAAYPTAPAPASSTSCTEEKETPAPTPAPVPSEGAYTPAPQPTPEAPKPVSSAAAYPPAPKPETPKPVSSAAAYPPAPQPEAPKPVSSAAAYPPAPKPEAPKPVSSAAAYPPAPKPEAPKPSSSAAAYTPVPKPEAPKPSSSAAASPSKPVSSKAADKPKPTGGYSSSGHITTNGDKWAMTYTPYANSGDCKTPAEIKDDIKKISELGFTTIRSYSTDCGVFETVVPECQKYGLKVIYGIFLEGPGKGPFSEYANAQLDDIAKKAPKDSVAMVIVGNECMFNNNCEATELASYIDHVRDELHSCGFPKDIAVTTTEPVGTWEEKGAALCDHIDIFTVQVHPYFTSSISAEEAGDFAAQQLEQAAKVCPEAAAKGKYITEIGWPSAGQSNGKAIAGVSEQKTAMTKIMEKVGSEACLFSFQNDGWKDPGALGVEQHFGCIEAIA
ncbi:hypothetical protein NX059_003894 [Plenodomus lindquistii]|nr:hypothetical protein NX059_003894 [Plenodomus lindquistii]